MAELVRENPFVVLGIRVVVGALIVGALIVGVLVEPAGKVVEVVGVPTVEVGC